jgi:hypothetical protein
MVEIRHRFTGQDYITTVQETRIKFKDIFNIKELYTQMHDWLVEEGYADKSDKKFKEIFYHHRWTQTGGEEVRFWWRLGKELSSYYKYEMDINVLVIGLKNTDIVVQGQKFKANTGECELKVHARVIADQKGEWKKHWLLKHFHKLFYRRVFFKQTEMHRKQLYLDVYRFMEFLKTHFKLKKYRPEPEGEQFYPNKDYE